MGTDVAKCVLLADRHQSLSEGVRGLLETEFNTVFMVADEASLTKGAQQLRPALIVADLSFVPGDAIGFVRRLRGNAGAAKVLLLSVHEEPAVAKAALAAGADAVVIKRAIATDLLPCIDALLAGYRPGPD